MSFCYGDVIESSCRLIAIHLGDYGGIIGAIASIPTIDQIGTIATESKPRALRPPHSDFMISIEYTSPSLEANLAFDEALIEVAEMQSVELGNHEFPEILRLWEMQSPCVVLGRASKRAVEVNLEACESDAIPVLRRASGGASVVAGPGCLMYSVLLSYDRRPAWRMLNVAHSEVMRHVGGAIQACLREQGVTDRIEFQGTCDLTIGGRKFSGNAVRCKRQWMLYHGTILVDMPLEWIVRYLREPPRQPDYRERRNHLDFVTRLLPGESPIPSREMHRSLRSHLVRAWNATDARVPNDVQRSLDTRAQTLLESRYNNPAWHEQL
jgi:lipoate-protein ligase A